jgi:hypothetical protein
MSRPVLNQAEKNLFNLKTLHKNRGSAIVYVGAFEHAGGIVIVVADMVKAATQIKSVLRHDCGSKYTIVQDFSDQALKAKKYNIKDDVVPRLLKARTEAVQKQTVLAVQLPEFWALLEPNGSRLIDCELFICPLGRRPDLGHHSVLASQLAKEWDEFKLSFPKHIIKVGKNESSAAISARYPLNDQTNKPGFAGIQNELLACIRKLQDEIGQGTADDPPDKIDLIADGNGFRWKRDGWKFSIIRQQD